MGSEGKRGNSRYPTYLVSGLLICNVFFIFKWWSLSAMNNELLMQVVDFGDALKISADAHNACEVKIMQAENKLKTSISELIKTRDSQEKSRVENVESKRQMLVKNEEDNRLQKECEYVQSSLESCKSELESHQQKEKSLDKTIRSMKRNEISNTKNLDLLSEKLESRDKTIEFLRNRDTDPSDENHLQLAKSLQIISSQDKAIDACSKQLKALQSADITSSELINALKREKERLLSNQQQLKKSPTSSGPVLDALVSGNQVDSLGSSDITEVKKIQKPSDKKSFTPSQKPTEKLTKRVQKSTTEEYVRSGSQKTGASELYTTTRSSKASTQEYFVRKAQQQESHILKNKVNEFVPLPRAVTYLDTDIDAHKDSISTLHEKKNMKEDKKEHRYINDEEVKDEEEEEEKHASEELKEAEERHTDKRYLYKNVDKESEDYEKRFEEAFDI